MPAGAAAGQHHSVDRLQLGWRQVQTTKDRCGIVMIEPPPHGSADSLGLLVNFFEHEMGVIAPAHIIGGQLQ